MLKREKLLKDKYEVNEKEYNRLFSEDPFNIIDFEEWEIFYKYVAIHKKLNTLFQPNPFLLKLLLGYGYQNLIADKNQHGCIGELNRFSFDHISSMQLRSDVSTVGCADTVTGVITFPYFHNWEEIKNWIDKVPENNFSVYIINPILLFYGIGTVGLFLTPKYYNGYYIESCNHYIIGLTGYPLFLTFSMDETVEEINYVDLELSKEHFIEELDELSGKDRGLFKMLKFWLDNDEVSIPLIESSYKNYLDVQHYMAPDTINFVKMTSEKPFKLVHEDTGEILGTFTQFCLDEKFNVIDTENGEFNISDRQGKDLLDGKYNFII